MNRKAFTLVLAALVTQTLFGAKLASRIAITKKSEWAHTQWNEAIEGAKNETLSKKRRLYIQEIEKTLGRNKTVKIVDNHIELVARLTRYSIEEHYAALSQNKKSESDLYLNKAAKVIDQTLYRYPNHARAHEFVYLRALVYSDRQQVEASIRTFQKLIANYPNSKYVHDARAQVGDYYFEQKKTKEAEAMYDAVIQAKFEPLMSYATFRKAWCAYDTGRLQDSIDLFRWIIVNEKPSAKSLKMRDEALNDVVYPLTDSESPEKVLSFFQAYDKNTSRKGLESAALLWFERGFYAQSNTLWGQLLGYDSLHPKNALYEIRRVDGLFLKGEKEAAIKLLIRSLPTYFAQSEWSAANATNKTTAEYLKKWEEIIVKQSVFFHASGDRNKNTKELAIAKEGYFQYLKYFEDKKEAGQIMTQLAALLYQTKEYPEAAKYFYLSTKKVEDKALAKKNFEAAIDTKSLTIVEPKGKGPFALSETEKMFILWVDEYSDSFPGSDKADPFQLRKAHLLNARGESKEALSLAEDLSEKKGKTGEDAAMLAMDIWSRDKKWEEMSEFADTLLKVHVNATFRKDVGALQRKAELKRIEAQEGEKKYADAAKGYLKYAQKHGPADAKLYEVAVFNAAGNFTKAEKYEDAAQTRELFLKKFPESEQRPDMLLSLAEQYEKFAEFGKSAKLLDTFIKENPKSKKLKMAMDNAATFYAAEGMSKQADRLLAQYEEKYPRETASVQKRRLSLYRAAGWKKKERQVLAELAEEGSYAEQFIHKVALAEWRTGEIGTKAAAEFKEDGAKHISAIRKNRLASEAFGRVLNASLKKDEREFKGMRLTGTGERLANKVKAKIARLKEFEKEVSKLGRLGSPEWKLASLYKSGAMYRTLATEIQQLPIPKELTGEEIEAYRKGVNETLVAPLNKKAVSIVERCMESATQFQILTDWTAKCYALGSSLDDKKFAAVRTFYLPHLEATYLDDDGDEEADSEKFAAERALSSVGSEYETTLPAPFPVKFTHAAPETALQAVKEALKESPNSPALKNRLALVYIRMGKFDMAERLLNNLLIEHPKMVALHTNLGILYFAKGEEQKGILMFEKAGTNSQALRNLGHLALRSHNGVLAKKYFETVPQKSKKDRIAGMIADIQTYGMEEGLLIAAEESEEPLAQIQAVYYLIDVEKDMNHALQVIQSYYKNRTPAEEDGLFQRALQEIKNNERVAILVSQ